MSLTMRATLAARHVDVDLQLCDGERVALLGPNGAGKSTVLGILAGVLRPDTGRAELDGRVLFDLGRPDVGPQSPRVPSAHHWSPPWSRGTAMLAQDPLLFPHLTVRENVAFGPRSRGKSTAEARRVADRWLTEVGAQEFATRKPAQLSGGQAQRVAIARALATEPRLLLLDEPLAALDVGAAPALRRVLRQVLAERSAVLVTHDLLDALLLAHRVLVLEEGRIVEAGPTDEVMRHPRTSFTARLAGLNLIVGRSEADGVRDGNGVLIRGVNRTATTVGEAAMAVFGPTAVAVHTEAPQGSPRNTIAVTITEFEPRDQLVRVRAEGAGGHSLVADVLAQTVGDLDLYPGRPVYFSIKATAVTIYPA
jgi:molybdate transport system ATP-binding protein